MIRHRSGLKPVIDGEPEKSTPINTSGMKSLEQVRAERIARAQQPAIFRNANLHTTPTPVIQHDQTGSKNAKLDELKAQLREAEQRRIERIAGKSEESKE